MSNWCPTCGRPKQEHTVQRRAVRGPAGMEFIKQRICPVTRRPGPRLAGRPDVYKPTPQS